VNRKRTKVWTTKAGEMVRVCDMADSHLLNTIRFLERAELADGLALACLPGPTADHAQDAHDEAIRELAERSPGDVWPIYDDMVDEAMDRGLTLPSGM
jgi:hypothetical protein